MVLIWLLLEPKGVYELVEFLKILIVTEEEEDFIDVIFGANGWAEGSH